MQPALRQYKLEAAFLKRIKPYISKSRIVSMLMGDEVAPRREFIESHAKYARIDV